jgi:hypothetical protein
VNQCFAGAQADFPPLQGLHQREFFGAVLKE